MNRLVRTPGSDRPISIVPTPGRVVVKAGSRVIADTYNALPLKEAAYPAVPYIPRQHADIVELTYFSLVNAENAVWSYEIPHPAIAAIEDRLAFYPYRVDSIEVRET